MAVLPKQKILYKDKVLRDEVTGKTWGETCVDFFIDETQSSSIREQILSSLRLCDNGELEERDYEYVLNPFNTTIDRYKRFGARLRNYDIITPVTDLYMGEFYKRFKNFLVIASNPEDSNSYQRAFAANMVQYYSQKLINELNQLGIDTGKPSKELEDYTSRIENFKRTYKGNNTITGQEILDYIKFAQDLDDKFQEAYGYWIKTGLTCSYKGIFHNDVDYEIVPSWQITFPQNLRSPFLEDSQWITRRQIMTANEILDRFHDKLAEDEVTWLENKDRDTLLSNPGYVALPTQWISSQQDYRQASILRDVQGLEVYHCQWRSFRKVGVLTYMNEVGQIQEMEVEETYKLDKTNGDIAIEWGWISQVWEGWRIGDTGEYIYIDVRPLPYNRMELNNSSSQKLSYNGRVNININNQLISLPFIGRNHQILYNILKYQFEKIINKNKDKIIVLPQGLIPKGKGGWDEEKFMYYAHANSLMVIDETSPTAGLALQGIKVLDMSLGQYAKEAIELMQSVKNEWWDSIGMNRQRFGDSMASDGKGVTEQAIFRSSLISEELIRKFEKFQEKEYSGLLDISKIAFIKGKKRKYINSDGREALLDLNEDDIVWHLNSDYDIHVINSGDETEKIKSAKEFGFSLGQNGDALTMLELIGSRNFEKTKEIVAKIDNFNKQREEANQQAALESNERVAELNNETQQAKNDVEIYKADKDYDKAIDVKLLEINNTPENEEGGDSDNMAAHKRDIDKENLKLKRDEFNQSKKESNQKILESKAKIKNMNKPVKNN